MDTIFGSDWALQVFVMDLSTQDDLADWSHGMIVVLGVGTMLGLHSALILEHTIIFIRVMG